MNWGNQHTSRKAQMLDALDVIRALLKDGLALIADEQLDYWWQSWVRVPASTRRRWRAGK